MRPSLAGPDPREVAGRRDETGGRLEPVAATPHGRQPDAATGVAADTECRDARRGGDALTGARTARRAHVVDGMAHRRAAGHAAPRLGLGQHDRARGP